MRSVGRFEKWQKVNKIICDATYLDVHVSASATVCSELRGSRLHIPAARRVADALRCLSMFFNVFQMFFNAKLLIVIISHMITVISHPFFQKAGSKCLQDRMDGA